MIRVVRSPEPATLTAARQRRLPAAIAAYNLHGAPSAQLSTLLSGYSATGVKKALYLGQHKKCAYCEQRTPSAGSPIEHYRPKDGADRHERGQSAVRDVGHYWWLTWTWSNLLFSCVRCNGRGHKANYFQVRAGTASTVPTAPVPTATADPVVAVDTEQPLFLDPADPAVDPITVVWWQPVDPNLPPRQWVWTVRWADDRGRVTASNLRLDELAHEVASHVRKDIVNRAETVRTLALSGQLPAARQAWDLLLQDKLHDPVESFRGPTWKALDLLIPPADRAAWGLSPLNRP